MVLLAVGANDVLNGHPQGHLIESFMHRKAFEVIPQRSTPVPRHVRRRLDHVVAVECRYWDECRIVHIEPRHKWSELGTDCLVCPLLISNEIHLVDANDDVIDAQQRGGDGMAA